MTLKDRFKVYQSSEAEEKDKLWYNRAFGHLRNIMKIDITFVPRPDLVPLNKFTFFVTVNYTMFPEMEEEFKIEDYPVSETYPMEVDLAEEGIAEYFLELERPYGSYTTSLWYKEIDGPADQELKPV